MGKTLADYPELLKEWHLTKNGDLNPENFKFMSNKKVWWQCQMGHEWEATIEGRTRKRGCPYCAGQKVCHTNCLATLKPDVAKDWHPTKNGDLNPENVITGSNKKVWWQCQMGHEWEASISNRTLIDTGCPYCAGQKVCHTNCLATLKPDVAKDWHPTKNILNPNDVTICSGKKVWWQCQMGHEWTAVISQRTSYNSGCPYCNESKGEKEVRRILVNHGINFTTQAKFDDCKYKNKLPFDFSIMVETNQYLIEYNGIQHYELVRWSGLKESHKKSTEKMNLIKLRDKIKKEWCQMSKIPLLIIPYWEYSNIELLVMNFLKRA